MNQMITSTKIPVIIILFLSIALVLPSCKKKPTPPVVTTGGVSAITQTTAGCGGNVTGDGGAEVTARGVCFNTSENPETSNSKTSDGKGTGSFTSTLTSLTPGTKYYVRAYATNSEGTAYGSQVSFTTSPVLLATLITSTVSSITGTTVISGGNITSDGGGSITAKGVCWAETVNPTTSDNKTNDGTGSNSFTSNITGLTPGKIYHVRAYAVNSLGTAYGNDLQFTTGGATPLTYPYNATDILSTSATLVGYVDANYASTIVTFEYGTTDSYGQSTTAIQSPLTGGGSYVEVNKNITGLAPGTIYHFRIKAVNSFGTKYSSDMTFTTLGGPPQTYPYNATEILSTSATLVGYVDANYSSTTVTFEYGTTDSYGQSTTAIQSPLTGGGSYVEVTKNITGLAPGTIYHFRIKAVNVLGTTYSSDMTFATLGGPPQTYPYNATDILSTSATFVGYVDPNYSSATVTFEYGITDSYGQDAAAIQSPLTGGGSYVEVTRNITGLAVGSTYHFRIKAVNALGTTYSSDMTFTTLGGPPQTYPYNATNILTTSATLVGYVDPNYSSTTITFEYGTTENYGQSIVAAQSPLTGGGSYVEVTRNITGLAIGTTYHFRIKAVNALGTTYSSDMTFITATGK
jgi:hypothetical protein